MQIPVKYKEIYDKSLKEKMQKECSGDFGAALKYLAVDPVTAECAMIKKACDGIGTNEQLLSSILCGRSNEDMELLKKTYYKIYTKDLVAKVSGETSGDTKKALIGSLQAAEEEFDPGYHTEEKAREDAEQIYNDGQGRFGTNEKMIIKTIVMSPPKYLKLVNEQYADKYGYTLFKAIEKEFSGDSKEALLHTLGIKLKPYETIAKLIETACAGFGTNELLLTCTLIRYQKYLPHVCMAHEDIFGKSVQTSVVDECSGDYKKLLLAVVNVVSPDQ